MKKTNLVCALAAFATASTSLISTASADITIYRDRSAWEAALNNIQTETFDSYANPAANNNDNNIRNTGQTFMTGPTNFTLTSWGSANVTLMDGVSTQSTRSVNGTPYVQWWGTTAGNILVTATPQSGPVSGFGFDYNLNPVTMSNGGPHNRLQLIVDGQTFVVNRRWDATGLTDQNAIDPLPVGSGNTDPAAGFFGIIDDTNTFTSAQINSPTTNFQEFGWDNFSTGTSAVPEPSSAILLGLSGLGLAFRRKR